MMHKFSIAVVTYNTLFYTQLQLMKLREHIPAGSYEILVYDNGSTDGTREWLAEQPEVRLYTGASTNDRSHGQALDFLAEKASHAVFCTLDADAWPVSDNWTDPMFALSDDVVLAGIDREWGFTLKRGYIHPSYLFGWTEWVRKFTFSHIWPEKGNKYDTGEKVTEGVFAAGKQIRCWNPKMVTFDDRFTPKPCDYAGLVWHVWWSSRKAVSPGLVGQEFEDEYHDFCVDFFRKKYDLDF